MRANNIIVFVQLKQCLKFIKFSIISYFKCDDIITTPMNNR